MPGFDGTGPQGRGPLTGRARGYCVLRESKDPSNHVRGFAGVQGTPVDAEISEGKEVVDMPLGNSVGPTISRPMVGRPVLYPGWGSGFWWAPFGRSFGRGGGWGRGCGCFGYRR